MLKKTVFSFLVATSVLFAQNELDINVNSDTYEFGVNGYLNNLYYLDDNSKYYFGAHFLGTDTDDRLSQKLVSVDLKVMNMDSNDQGISFGLGAKGIYTDSDAENMMAVALGVLVRYVPDKKIHFDGSYHYAPAVLNYLDGDSYREARATANYAVVNNGYIYTGLRHIKADFKKGAVDFDRGVFAGFKFTF